MFSAERERVTEISRTAGYSEGVMSYTTRYCGEIFRRYMKPGSVLELGPAKGVMTDILFPAFSDDYTIVDGAEFFVEESKKRHPGIKGEACLFEDYKPARKFDNIILGHVLEHVEDPVGILKLCSTWMRNSSVWGGVILAAVPNSNSLHRQAAVKMGMLEHVDSLNPSDIKNGHRRVYNLSGLKSDFENAGLRIIKSGGYWLKTLSNAQINEYYTAEMIDAFLKLGEEYPEIAGEIYVVASI